MISRKDLLAECLELQKEEIMKQVKEAAKNGQYDVYFKKGMSCDLIDELRNHGYFAENGDYVDYSKDGDGSDVIHVSTFNEYHESKRYRSHIDLNKDPQDE